MIIEFAGLPRSGKSTSIDTLTDYYSRNGYNVVYYSEGIREIPFPRRKRIKTAFWVSNSIVNDVIALSTNEENLQNRIIFQDRGLFDSMAFINLLNHNHFSLQEDKDLHRELSQRGIIATHLEQLSFWAKYIDLVILLDVKPEAVMKRDLANQLNSGPGLITNLDTLAKLQLSYQEVKELYGARFPKIVKVDSSDGKLLETIDKIREIIDVELFTNE